MAGKKKKSKAKKVAKPVKAKAKPKAKAKAAKPKRRIVSRKTFAARAKMLGVVCIKANGEAAVVKRFTKDVRDAADKGEIVALLLKGPRLYRNGEFTAVKSAKSEVFLGLVPEDAPVAPAPSTAPVVEESAVPLDEAAPAPYSNGRADAPEQAAAAG